MRTMSRLDDRFVTLRKIFDDSASRGGGKRQRDLQVGERRAAVQVVLDSVQNSCVSEPRRTRVSQPFLDQRREELEPGRDRARS